MNEDINVYTCIKKYKCIYITLYMFIWYKCIYNCMYKYLYIYVSICISINIYIYIIHYILSHILKHNSSPIVTISAKGSMAERSCSLASPCPATATAATEARKEAVQRAIGRSDRGQRKRDTIPRIIFSHHFRRYYQDDEHRSFWWHYW